MLRKTKNKIRNYLWKILKVNIKLNSGITLNVKSDNDFFVFTEIFLNKEYDEAIDIFLEKELNKPIILDLGANVGYFTLRVADELLQKNVNNFLVYSIEASSGNFSKLKERISQPVLNNKVIARHGLVGLKEGFSYLSTETSHYGYAVSNKKANNDKVDYVDIEKLINAENSPIALIKCDIEGSEETFLSEYPSLLRRTELMVIEFHNTNIQYSKCLEYLESAGLFYKSTLNEDPVYDTSVQIFKRL